MYHRPYRVIVIERGSGNIHHGRSTFTDLQSAIDRAWQWLGKGYDVQIENRAFDMVVWRSYVNTPFGDEHINPLW
jgi:hypothetical protein